MNLVKLPSGKFIALALIAVLFAGCTTTPLKCQETRGVIDSNQRPIYPPDSKNLSEQVKTTLNVFVNRLGYVQEIELHQSSGYKKLDDSAIEAVKKWRFAPATISGKNIDAWVLVPIDFGITDN